MFGRKPLRVLSIDLVSMCYETCCRGIEYRCGIESCRSNRASKQRTRAMIVLVERYCKTCVCMYAIYMPKRNLYVRRGLSPRLSYRWLRPRPLSTTTLLEDVP